MLNAAIVGYGGMGKWHHNAIRAAVPGIEVISAYDLRPEAMEEASVMMVGLNPERVMQGLVQLQYQSLGEERNLRPVADYSMPNVSEKVVRIIISYTDYIKRVVWNE